MQEKTELIMRRPGESSLEAQFDKNNGEYVFALKEHDRVTALARFELIESPIRCFYWRNVTTIPSYLGRGRALTLMKKVSESLMRRGEMCVAYQLTSRDNQTPEQSKMVDRVERLLSELRKSGWSPIFHPDGLPIWGLNVPEEEYNKVLAVIDHLALQDALS